MREEKSGSRRSFIACCVCAGCAGMAGAAEPSSRNARSLKGNSATGGVAVAAAAGKKSYDISYCGITCAACELHLKGNKNGKKCKGCTHPSMESKCEVFNCAKEKKVVNCGLCESFETCEKLQKHHEFEQRLYRKAARRTCAKIKSDGMEAVVAEQKTRWTCKSCGKLFPWNTKGTCPSCDKPVDALSDKDV